MIKKFELDEDFEWFLEKFGEPTSRTNVNEDTLTKYRGKLPDRLLEYWQEYGFCGFQDGLFWIVNPEDFEGTLDTWLENTDIPQQDNFHVIARNAFGELYVWGEKTGLKYEITPANAWVIEKKGNEKDIANNNALDSIQEFFYLQKPKYMDEYDNEENPLFEPCKILHGALAYDEMYAFEPALFLGGEAILENTAKVNIFVHLQVLASFGQIEVLDHDGLVGKAFG